MNNFKTHPITKIIALVIIELMLWQSTALAGDFIDRSAHTATHLRAEVMAKNQALIGRFITALQQLKTLKQAGQVIKFEQPDDVSVRAPSFLDQAPLITTTEKLNQCLDALAIMPADNAKKLDIAAKIFAVSPAFLGNKPPFFIPYEGQIFAKYAYDYADKNTLEKPITLLSYGIGDARRVYEKVMFCRALGIQVQVIGVAYDLKVIPEITKILPKAKIIIQDLLSWTKEDRSFHNLAGTIDFVDASFLFHHIYTFAGMPKPESSINHTLGQDAVKSLLFKSSSLLKDYGKIVIMDGYLFKNGKDLVKIQLTENYAKAYDKLQYRYKPVSLPNRNLQDNNTLQLTFQQLAIVCDKLTLITGYRRRQISPERIEQEMLEQLAFWTEKEWVNALKKAGLNVAFIGHYRFGNFFTRDKSNVTILTPTIDFPRPYQLIIACKGNVEGGKVVRDSITTLKPLSSNTGGQKTKNEKREHTERDPAAPETKPIAHDSPLSSNIKIDHHKKSVILPFGIAALIWQAASPFKFLAFNSSGPVAIALGVTGVATTLVIVFLHASYQRHKARGHIRFFGDYPNIKNPALRALMRFVAAPRITISPNSTNAHQTPAWGYAIAMAISGALSRVFPDYEPLFFASTVMNLALLVINSIIPLRFADNDAASMKHASFMERIIPLVAGITAASILRSMLRPEYQQIIHLGGVITTGMASAWFFTMWKQSTRVYPVLARYKKHMKKLKPTTNSRFSLSRQKIRRKIKWVKALSAIIITTTLFSGGLFSWYLYPKHRLMHDFRVSLTASLGIAQDINISLARDFPALTERFNGSSVYRTALSDSVHVTDGCDMWELQIQHPGVKPFPEEHGRIIRVDPDDYVFTVQPTLPTYGYKSTLEEFENITQGTPFSVSLTGPPRKNMIVEFIGLIIIDGKVLSNYTAPLVDIRWNSGKTEILPAQVFQKRSSWLKKHIADIAYARQFSQKNNGLLIENGKITRPIDPFYVYSPSMDEAILAIYADETGTQKVWIGPALYYQHNKFPFDGSVPIQYAYQCGPLTWFNGKPVPRKNHDRTDKANTQLPIGLDDKTGFYLDALNDPANRPCIAFATDTNGLVYLVETEGIFKGAWGTTVQKLQEFIVSEMAKRGIEIVSVCHGDFGGNTMIAIVTEEGETHVFNADKRVKDDTAAIFIAIPRNNLPPTIPKVPVTVKFKPISSHFTMKHQKQERENREPGMPDAENITQNLPGETFAETDSLASNSFLVSVLEDIASFVFIWSLSIHMLTRLTGFDLKTSLRIFRNTVYDLRTGLNSVTLTLDTVNRIQIQAQILKNKTNILTMKKYGGKYQALIDALNTQVNAAEKICLSIKTRITKNQVVMKPSDTFFDKIYLAWPLFKQSFDCNMSNEYLAIIDQCLTETHIDIISPVLLTASTPHMQKNIISRHYNTLINFKDILTKKYPGYSQTIDSLMDPPLDEFKAIQDNPKNTDQNNRATPFSSDTLASNNTDLRSQISKVSEKIPETSLPYSIDHGRAFESTMPMTQTRYQPEPELILSNAKNAQEPIAASVATPGIHDTRLTPKKLLVVEESDVVLPTQSNPNRRNNASVDELAAEIKLLATDNDRPSEDMISKIALIQAGCSSVGVWDKIPYLAKAHDWPLIVAALEQSAKNNHRRSKNEMAEIKTALKIGAERMSQARQNTHIKQDEVTIITFSAKNVLENKDAFTKVTTIAKENDIGILVVAKTNAQMDRINALETAQDFVTVSCENNPAINTDAFYDILLSNGDILFNSIYTIHMDTLKQKNRALALAILA